MSKETENIQKKKAPRPNMQMVADSLGISKATVSRVLSGAKTSDEMKTKVKRACEEIGYELNPSIQDIITERRGGLMRNIAYVMVHRDFADPGYSLFLDGIARVLHNEQFHLHLVWLDGSERTRYELPQLLRDGRFDGILLSGLVTPEIVNLLQSLEKPIVLMGFFPRITVKDIPNVQGDIERWCYDAACAIHDNGLKRFAYFTEKKDTYFDEAIFNLFKLALNDVGLPFDSELYYEGDGLLTGAFDSMRDVFASPDPLPFDCIVCWDTRVAQEIAGLILARFGFNKTPDVTLLTSTPYKQKFNVPAVLIDTNPAKTANHASRLLLDILKDSIKTSERIRIQV